jgi:hypothetical protein
MYTELVALTATERTLRDRESKQLLLIDDVIEAKDFTDQSC